MSTKERILDVIHVGEFPVYEVVELQPGGDIQIRHVSDPDESITFDRKALPTLIEVLSGIKLYC